MRMEAGRTEVLGICHRQRHPQVSRRRLCPCGWRLKALTGKQAASSLHLERQILQLSIAFDLQDHWVARFELF